MLSQSEESRKLTSTDIEQWMTAEKATVEFFVSRYGQVLERKLGYDRTDLESEIREQVWKGLISHDPSKTANLKTYINTLIKNRFKTLYGRSKLDKFSLVDFYADVFNGPAIDSEHTETAETGESLYAMRETILRDLVGLQGKELLIYEDLLLMNNIATMMKKHEMSKPEVVRTINAILGKLKTMRGEDEQA